VLTSGDASTASLAPELPATPGGAPAAWLGAGCGAAAAIGSAVVGVTSSEGVAGRRDGAAVGSPCGELPVSCGAPSSARPLAVSPRLTSTLPPNGASP
jgi:hypothetical protein